MATVIENENQDYDSLDELEKEVMGGDEADKELAKIQQKRRDDLKRKWKLKQQEMAQVIYPIYPCTL